MVFENRADTPLHTESDKEDFLSTMDQPNTTEMSAPDLINEALDEAEDFFPETSDKGKSRKRPAQIVKKMWSMEEEEEIRIIFKAFFDSKTRPKPNFCVKALHQSKKKNGLIWKRKKDVLKKKVFRMIDKL